MTNNIKITKARQIALDILYQVIHNKQFSNKLLGLIEYNYIALDKDIRLAYKIVYGTLQNKIFLEYIINNFINPKKTDNKIQILLWLSLYQLYFLNKIPPYAIVYEAVEISKKINIKFSSLINAVLNKIIRLKNVIKLINNSTLSENNKFLLKYSMPKNMFDLLNKNFSHKKIIEFIKDSISEPKLSYRINTNLIENKKFISLFSKKYSFTESNITKNGIISSKPLVKSSLFYEGYIIAQDEMAQKISEILDPNENDVILDMCAAPGGKTTHISQLMKNNGRIDAFEINSKKINLLNSNVKKLKCENINVINLNVNNYTSNILYDKILLDPPCSGFGVIKRKPEIKYMNIKQSTINNLISKQWELLLTSYKLLKKNGTLVYSTCTINYYENEDLIKKFVNKFSDMKIIKEEQIFGYENNTDGFYYCKIIKN